MVNNLPVMDTVKSAWEKVGGTKKTFWAILAIIFAMQFCVGFAGGYFETPQQEIPPLLGVISVIVGLVTLFLSWGLLYMGIRRAMGQPIQYGMAAYAFTFHVAMRIFGLYIVQAVLLGFISLLLALSASLYKTPNSFSHMVGVVIYFTWLYIFLWAIFRMYLAKGFVLQDGKGPIDAITMSFNATRGNVWSLIGIAAVNILIIMICSIPAGLGLIWGLPFVFINYGEVFKRLSTKF